MRKYILAITLIFTGIIFLVYNYLANNQNSYTESLFSDESKLFEKNFDTYIQSVENNIKSLQQNFNDVEKINDTVFIKDFLFPFIEKDPYLLSIALLTNSNKLVIRKEEKSIIMAVDSTNKLDIVRWQRFENEKLISTWQESFDDEINNTPWFVNLKKNQNQIQWLLKSYADKNEKDPDHKLFYAGYSYSLDGKQRTFLFQFSRKELLKNFNIDPSKNSVGFSIKSNKDNLIDLTELKFDNDRLDISKIKHFKKFDKSNSGIFSFNFKEDTYWNSFKRYPKETGLKYYLLTISEKDLRSTYKNFDLLNKIALFFMIMGVVILLIRKRFFYRPSKRIKIPPVKKILTEDENRYLEFKSSVRWDYRQEKTNPELEKVILKTLAALGNTDGGILLIGVDDDKNIIGLEKDFQTLKKATADYYEIHLRNILHNNLGVKYVSNYIRTEFETCDNQNMICKIKILAADEPVFLKFKNKNGQTEEKFFVRSGNSSQEITSIAEINDYINTRFKK